MRISGLWKGLKKMLQEAEEYILPPDTHISNHGSVVITTKSGRFIHFDPEVFGSGMVKFVRDIMSKKAS